MNLPGFELLERIGAGGMGEVYRARQVSLERDVAVKLLSYNKFENRQEALERFQREAKVLAKLSHPNVVPIIDMVQFEDQAYLVMEYVEGQNLRSVMRRGEPLALKHAFQYLEPIAKALEYIHGQSILHRDLKPENVLLGDKSVVKIADFGLASLARDVGRITNEKDSCGSLDYMAPEQRHHLEVDQRADVYSFAVMTYEMLSGELPLGVFEPLSEHNPDMPVELDRVLEKGLKRDPDERFGSVEEYYRELRAASGLREAPDSSRGNRTLLIVLGVLALAALAGVLPFVWPSAPDPNRLRVRLNELLPKNDNGMTDANNDNDDWLELYNPTDQETRLGGLYLTDDEQEAKKWMIPRGVVIPPKGFLVIWCDNEPSEGELHARFKLSAAGESIFLYDVDGATLIDTVQYWGMDGDQSYGRDPSNTDNWMIMLAPTPGRANKL